MKQFVKMIDVANKKSIAGKEARKNPSNIKQHFFELAKKAQVFIFSSNVDAFEPQKDAFKVDSLDLPFQTVSFESESGAVLSQDTPESIKTQGENLMVRCIMVNELAPREYEVFYLMEYHNYNNGQRILNVMYEAVNDDSFFDEKEQMTQGHALAMGIIKPLLERLRIHRSGVESVQYKKKHKVDKRNHVIKINKVVHISPKRTIDKALPVASKKIDWSHNWSVRGHWRQVKSIGKDRDGNYCISGFTWVSDHIKGDKDKQFIKKQRVL